MGLQFAFRDMPAMARQRYLNAEEASFALDDRMRGGGISPLWGPDGGMRHAAAGARPDANVPPPPGSGSKGSGGTGDPRRIGSVATWVGGAIQIGTRDQRSGRAKVTVSTGGWSCRRAKHGSAEWRDRGSTS